MKSPVGGRGYLFHCMRWRPIRPSQFRSRTCTKFSTSASNTAPVQLAVLVAIAALHLVSRTVEGRAAATSQQNNQEVKGCTSTSWNTCSQHTRSPNGMAAAAADAAVPPVRWGIIGCGDVTEKKSGPALQGALGSELVAVMRRTPGTAADFAARHNVEHAFESAAELCACADVTAICTCAVLRFDFDFYAQKLAKSKCWGRYCLPAWSTP